MSGCADQSVVAEPLVPCSRQLDSRVVIVAASAAAAAPPAPLSLSLSLSLSYLGHTTAVRPPDLDA